MFCSVSSYVLKFINILFNISTKSKLQKCLCDDFNTEVLKIRKSLKVYFIISAPKQKQRTQIMMFGLDCLLNFNKNVLRKVTMLGEMNNMTDDFSVWNHHHSAFWATWKTDSDHLLKMFQRNLYISYLIYKLLTSSWKYFIVFFHTD